MFPPNRAAALVLLLALAACDTPAEQWQAVEAPNTNTVEFVRLAHSVRFAPGAASLAPPEARRLIAFIDESEIAGGEDVYFEAAAMDALAQKRQTAIRLLLSRRGIRTVALTASAVPSGQRRADEVALQIERYVVTPPACPNWSKTPGGDPTNSVGSNFGCATTTNLGLMVAEPRDLLIGRKPGPADAEVAVRAIQNYRSGKSTAVPAELTGQTTPSASASGPGASAATTPAN